MTKLDHEAREQMVKLAREMLSSGLAAMGEGDARSKVVGCYGGALVLVRALARFIEGTEGNAATLDAVSRLVGDGEGLDLGPAEPRGEGRAPWRS